MNKILKIFFFKFIFSFYLIINIIIIQKPKRKIIGVVGLKNHNNIGNNLVKFSMNIKLKELGFKPIIIGYSPKNQNIDFLKRNTKLKEIKHSFLELREEDYDILMVNSDQTWNGNKNHTTNLLNRGYLKFAENWTIPRFVYGASLGVNYWKFSKNFEVIAKRLLKKFSGISVREKGAIKIVNKHLGINPQFVLDPTFIIDKKYYLDLIKNYHIKINFNFEEEYICVYQLDKNILIRDLIRKAASRIRYNSILLPRCFFFIHGALPSHHGKPRAGDDSPPVNNVSSHSIISIPAKMSMFFSAGIWNLFNLNFP